MQCISCDRPLQDAEVAAFAIMHERDFQALEVAPTVVGSGRFHAAPVCRTCHVTPTKRTRPLKAHFALPASLDRMLGKAGSSGKVG